MGVTFRAKVMELKTATTVKACGLTEREPSVSKFTVVYGFKTECKEVGFTCAAVRSLPRAM